MYNFWKKLTSIGMILITIATSVILGCSQETKKEGPYFGNGFRNGWADHNSIIIWTRLATIPDLNKSGVHFKELTKEQSNSLSGSTDKKTLHTLQIPEGYTLDQMDASCPGAEGEVKLILKWWSSSEELLPSSIDQVPFKVVLPFVATIVPSILKLKL